jgi:hypothetical protein
VRFSLLILSAIAIVSAQSSCDFDALFVHKLVLEAPRLPDVWKSLKVDAYRLEWRDSEGKRLIEEIQAGEVFSLSVARGLPQAILAYPLASNYSLRPAGFLYPADCDEDPDALPSGTPARARLSFASGYAAEVAEVLERLGFDAFAFPLNRLEDAWSGKGKDPWTLPSWKTAKALAEGAFRVSLFPAATAQLCLPSGDWLPESPFCPIRQREDGLREVVLPQGLSIFQGKTGILEIMIDEEGHIAIVADG